MVSDATSRKAKIDTALKRAADAGDVPGVVAMATDRSSHHLRGRVRQARAGPAGGDDAPTPSRGSRR